jgi:hypothetical protein
VSTSLVQNVIEPFDPRHHNIEEWLDAIDEFKAIYDWDDRTTSHFALNKLSGPAEVWYRGLPSRVFSWDQWREKLSASQISLKHYMNIVFKKCPLLID